MPDQPLYFDNNSTTFPAPEAIEALLPMIGDSWGNPSSTHSFGQRTRHEIEKARESVARMINCTPAEVVFNSGATEGNNTAIYSALEALPERKHIITTRTEHSSILEVIRYLGESGYRITELNVDRLGHVDLDEMRHEISGDTALVSMMWANNETGVINPVSAAGDIAKQFGALLHVDAAQAAGKLRIDLADEQAIDYLTLSAHKFHGLKGTGALFVRKDAGYSPMLRGGHHEGGRRAGTENVTGIVAMGAAARMVSAKLDEYAAHMRAMRDRLQSSLLNTIDDVIINGDQVDRLPNTLNAGFKYIDAEALLMMMDAEGICVSAGSACKSGSLEPSHVLMAMNVPLAAIHGSIRFCTSRYTSEEEVDTLVQKTAKIVKRLREMSPFGKAEQAELTREEIERHKAYFATA